MFGTSATESIKDPKVEYEAQDIVIYDGFISSLYRNTTYIPNTKTLLSGYSTKYNWHQETAYKVMMAESGGNPLAYNPEWHKGCQGSYGLFQISCLHGEKEELLNPIKNTEIAYKLWVSEGWRPWYNTAMKLGILE